MSMTEKKAALRKEIWAELAKLSTEERETSDAGLFETFLSLPQVQKAKTIFAFWGIPARRLASRSPWVSPM